MTLLPNLAPAAASALVAAAWQGVLLASLVALCLRLLPNLSAAVRSTVWLAVLATVAALHFTPAFTASAATQHATPIHFATGWSLALVALWLTFSITRAALLLRSAVHLYNISSRAIPMETPAAIAPLLRAGRRTAQLCLSTEVDRPSVAGFFAPRILLPASLISKLSGEELTQIVLHEMQHLHRNDDWTNLAQKFALALFPLNPALLWIERHLCFERELACDDGVLRITSTQQAGARKAYATTLANLAEHSLVRRSASLALAAWERRSELATRVHRILFRPAATMNRCQTLTATSFITLIVLTAAATLAHAPQLVSFAPPATAIAEQHSTMPLPTNTTFTPTHATLVEAALPIAPPHHHRSAPRRHIAVQTLAEANPQPAQTDTVNLDQNQQQTGWIVLTRWEYIPSQQTNSAHPHHRAPQSNTADQQQDSPTYTAVPMPGGWLILQL